MKTLNPFKSGSKAAPVAKPQRPGTQKKRQRGSQGVSVSAKERWISRAYLAPSLIGVIMFFLWPFGKVITYSVTDNPVNLEFVGLANFINVFNNSAFKSAAANTFRFSIYAVPLAVVLSLLLAMMLEARIPGKSRFRTFFLSPMMVPVASIVLIWQVIFSQNGALNNFLLNSDFFGWIRGLFGYGPYSAIDWLKSGYSQIVIVVLFLWKNLGYNMILFMSALSNIPKEQVEAASVDGAGAFRRFWIVKFRYLSPSILFVTILSLINSFKVFREVYLLTGDYPYDRLYLLQHFMNNTFGSFDFQKLSAAAIIMAVVVVLIIGALFIAEDRFGKDVEQ